MDIIVQKYGGSSLGTIEKIKKVAKTIVKRVDKGNRLVVVVSAMGDTTDELINLANMITQNPDKREKDALVATGEIISSTLLSMCIKDLGHDAISLNAYQISLRTNGDYGKALIVNLDSEKIKKELNENKIVIITGFQGISNNGDITTLGRGGSDTSAVAIAAKLNGKCEIYTDVDGIYGVDPRKYNEAKIISEINYEEMLELSSLGAQVMHSRSVELAQKYNIPLYVGLSCSEKLGTCIKGGIDMENKEITGIATCDSDSAITLQNMEYDLNLLSSMFEQIASRKINIDMISQTAPVNGFVNISFTIPKEDLSECLEIISNFSTVDKIRIDNDITKFSVVGLGMKTTSGVASKILRMFANNNIGVKMITTSEIRITCAINSKDKKKAIELVAKEYNL